MHVKALAIAVLLLSVAGPGRAEEAPAPLALACQAAADVEQKATGYEWTKGADGKYGYELKSGSVVKRKELRFDLIFEGGAGRLRMPGEPAGLFGKKPAGGWYPVERLQIGDDEIAGRVDFGFMDVQALRIDRRTGAFRIGEFKGDCQRMPTERKF